MTLSTVSKAIAFSLIPNLHLPFQLSSRHKTLPGHTFLDTLLPHLEDRVLPCLLLKQLSQTIQEIQCYFNIPGQIYEGQGVVVILCHGRMIQKGDVLQNVLGATSHRVFSTFWREKKISHNSNLTILP